MSAVAVLNSFYDLYNGTSIKVIDFATARVRINNVVQFFKILEKLSCEWFP